MSRDSVLITEQRILADAYKTSFRATFDDFSGHIDSFLTKPGCTECKGNLLSSVMSRPDLLKKYYGDVEFDIEVPETGPSKIDIMTIPSSEKFEVINCHVSQLQTRLNSLASSMSKFRLVGQARSGDEITVIIENI